MKKLVIFLLFLLSIVVAIPFVGSKMVDSEVLKVLDRLESNGIKLKNSSAKYSYLDSSKHYLFVIEDSDKFISYIEQIKGSKVDSYLHNLLNGMEIGTDLKYSNIPFSDKISLDFYPLSLSKDALYKITKKDELLKEFIVDFLESKNLLYHIDYNLKTTRFNGYIKDIDATYVTRKDDTVMLSLTNSTFNGEKLSLKPKNINSKTDELSYTIKNKKGRLDLTFEGIKSTLELQSNNEYSYKSELASFLFKIDPAKGKNIFINMKNLKLDLFTDSLGDKMEFSTKTSFDSLNIVNNDGTIKIDGFNYDIDIKNVDKNSYVEFNNIFTKSKSLRTKKLKREVPKYLSKLLANGIDINLVDFSVKNIDYHNDKDLNGFRLGSYIDIKRDSKLAKKIKHLKNLDISKIDLDLSLNISKKLFLRVLKEIPMFIFLKNYSQESSNNLFYKIKLSGGKALINDKKVN